MKKLLTILLVLAVIVGCSSHKNDASYAPDERYYTTEEQPGAAVSDYNGGNGPVYSGETRETTKNNGSGEKMVYTSNIVLETKKYDDLLKEVTQLVTQYQGFNEYIRENTGSYRTCSMTVRIPSASFDAFLDALRNSSGSVADLSINIDNITRQYNDAVLRIKTLETQYERLLDLLKKADNLEDIILLEDRISEVEYELETYNNYVNDMDADVAYSTISISIREVVIYTDAKTSYLQRLTEAVKGSLKNFAEWAGDFVIDVIYALPGLLAAAVILLIFRKPVTKMWEGRKNLPLIGKKKKEETVSAADSANEETK